MRNEEARISKLKSERLPKKRLNPENPEKRARSEAFDKDIPTSKDGIELEGRLTTIQEAADKAIESAVIVADYHADAALQIRMRYPREEAPIRSVIHNCAYFIGIFSLEYACKATKRRNPFAQGTVCLSYGYAITYVVVYRNVESHIQASDAARQEVRQLQGTVTADTAEKTAEANASRAFSKATEAKDEYFKAEKAANDDAH